MNNDLYIEKLQSVYEALSLEEKTFMSRVDGEGAITHLLESNSYLQDEIFNILVKTLGFEIADDKDEELIVKFQTLEDQILFESLEPWTSTGVDKETEGNNKDWVNLIYPNNKPKFYGVYQVRGY